MAYMTYKKENSRIYNLEENIFCLEMFIVLQWHRQTD